MGFRPIAPTTRKGKMALRVRVNEADIRLSATVNPDNYRELTIVVSGIFRLTAVPFGVLNTPENVVGVAGQSNNRATGSIRPQN